MLKTLSHRYSEQNSGYLRPERVEVRGEWREHGSWIQWSRWTGGITSNVLTSTVE